jgi:hypothetical protein
MDHEIVTRLGVREVESDTKASSGQIDERYNFTARPGSRMQTFTPVILIHGTFAKPIPGATNWYEAGSEFWTALDSTLAGLMVDVRCWDSGNGEPIFYGVGRMTGYRGMKPRAIFTNSSSL